MNILKKSTLTDLPKKIWFHWYQGEHHMPYIVKRCLASWKFHNPDWEVIFLDEDKVWEWLDKTDIPVESLRGTSEQVYANAVRVALLRRYGGVWVDATCWCRKPLSSWLLSYPGDFFAFSDPGSDRPMANWFMASLSTSYIIKILESEYLRIFRSAGSLKLFPADVVKEILSRSGDTGIFLDPIFLQKLKGYPYYLFHYLFADLIRRDSVFNEKWGGVFKISGSGPLEPGRVGFSELLTDNLKLRWGKMDSCVYKLNWRSSQVIPGSILDSILAMKI